MSEELKKDEEKKGLLSKLKEGMDDKEEQLAILSTFVRLGILVWSGGILTLAYIKLPPALGIPEQKLDWGFGLYGSRQPKRIMAVQMVFKNLLFLLGINRHLLSTKDGEPCKTRILTLKRIWWCKWWNK